MIQPFNFTRDLNALIRIISHKKKTLLGTKENNLLNAFGTKSWNEDVRDIFTRYYHEFQRIRPPPPHLEYALGVFHTKILIFCMVLNMKIGQDFSTKIPNISKLDHLIQKIMPKYLYCLLGVSLTLYFFLSIQCRTLETTSVVFVLILLWACSWAQQKMSTNIAHIHMALDFILLK